MWNYFRELNALQIDRFTVRPIMIHQYAGRIANLWELEMDRRPKVRVNSYVMLNYRFPQPLIDPSIDLANTKFDLFAHNNWILPFGSERLSEKLDNRTSPPR